VSSPSGDVPRSGGGGHCGKVCYTGERTSDETVNGMVDPRPDEAGKRRGRRAAAPTGPVGPLETAVAAVAAGLTAGRAGLVTARARGADALAAFRAGPVLPWVSAHRMLVLIGGALVVSGLAIGGAVAMISQVPGAVAEGEVAGNAGSGPVRPQPGPDVTMSSPVATPTPSPTPTPAPTPMPTPSPTDAVSEPRVTDPVEPATEPTDEGNGRPDPPGATNRPDKPKG
jgi:hypothetical protein